MLNDRILRVCPITMFAGFGDDPMLLAVPDTIYEELPEDWPGDA